MRECMCVCAWEQDFMKRKGDATVNLSTDKCGSRRTRRRRSQTNCYFPAEPPRDQIAPLRKERGAALGRSCILCDTHSPKSCGQIGTCTYPPFPVQRSPMTLTGRTIGDCWNGYGHTAVHYFIRVRRKHRICLRLLVSPGCVRYCRCFTTHFHISRTCANRPARGEGTTNHCGYCW